MDNYDVAGILRTYSEKARFANNTQHLHSIIRQLKLELDLRKVHMPTQKNNQPKKKGT